MISIRKKTVSFCASVALALAAILAFAGCHRDPSVRKQNFMKEADAYYAQAKYPEALLTYSRALQLDPRFAEAYYKLGRTNVKLGNFNAAFQSFSRCLELQPENWPAHLEFGDLLLAGGRGADAKDHASQILRADPSNWKAQILLSNADSMLGNAKEALQEARDAVNLAPGEITPYMSLAGIEARQGDTKSAEEHLKKAEALNPSATSSRIELGYLYSRLNRLNDAEKEFQEVLSLEPKNSLGRVALASIYVQQNRIDQAERTLGDAKQFKDTPAAYRLLGDFYVSRNDFAKGREEFRSLIAEHPDDLALKKTYAQLLIFNQQIPEASDLIDTILKSGPQDPAALTLRGQTMIEQRKFDDAVTTLQQATKNSPESFTSHYFLGVALNAKGRTSEAEQEWHEAVRLHPVYPEAWNALGQAATRKKDWNGLATAGERLQKISPRSPEGYLFSATSSANQGHMAEAEADLNKVIQMFPQSPLGYLRMGRLRVLQKRMPEADTLFQRALTLDPNSLEALESMVELDMVRNRPADALKRVQSRVQSDPKNGALYILLGRVQIKMQQLAEAESSFSKALEFNDKNLDALVLLATVQSGRKEQDAAIATYQRALVVSPDSVGLLFSLGALYDGKGDWKQAQSFYEKALAIQPDNAIAANNLAYLLLEHGNSINVALTLAQTARRGLPDSPSTADTLGWAYFHNAAYSLAAPLFEEAIQKSPSNSSYRYHLGVTYQKLGDSARAKVQLERAISLDPQSPLAGQARDALNSLSGG